MKHVVKTKKPNEIIQISTGGFTSEKMQEIIIKGSGVLQRANRRSLPSSIGFGYLLEKVFEKHQKDKHKNKTILLWENGSKPLLNLTLIM